MERLTYQQMKDFERMLCPTKKESDSDSDDGDLRQRMSRKKFGQGDIETSASTQSSESSEKDQDKKNQKTDEKSNVSDIWHPAEVNAASNLLPEDPRKVPQYEIKFKQAVGTEDVFLGMNMKTPGTASCEWITLRINLPEETKEKIELSVESDVVDLRSSKYRLRLPTPFPVDPNSSSAKWHSDIECLEITLKLSRELDDVNF